MIAVNFDKLSLLQKYDRPYLAKIWGYNGFQGISRGVVSPASDKSIIILFVTKEKQTSLTQYNDYIDGNLLYWEGENEHGSDNRIINSKMNGNKIHLFYRSIHHTSFTYYGEILLNNYLLKTEQPSEFTFVIPLLSAQNNLLDEIEEHDQELSNLSGTEKDAVVKSRIGQGKFRERLIEKWGACSVTNLSNVSLLRASHIKPWRDCTNYERLDPDNGLLLQPTLDHLFDIGMITFNGDGDIVISSKLHKSELLLLNISTNMALKKISFNTLNYLKYHQNNVFQP